MRTSHLLTTTAVLGTSIAAATPLHSTKPKTIHAWEDDSDNPLPLVIWHGLGDAANSEGLTEISQLADTIAPGIYVHIINPTGEGSDDRSATFLGNVTEQVQAVCDQLSVRNVLH